MKIALTALFDEGPFVVFIEAPDDKWLPLSLDQQQPQKTLPLEFVRIEAHSEDGALDQQTNWPVHSRKRKPAPEELHAAKAVESLRDIPDYSEQVDGPDRQPRTWEPRPVRRWEKE